MTLAKNLFETAKCDLKSVRVLYDSKHYNISLFQLQQAVEKFVKSYGLQLEIIKPEELTKKISHLPHRVFTKQLSKQVDELSKYSGTPILIPDIIPPHQRGADRTNEKIDGLRKLQNKIYDSAKPDENRNITAKDISQFLEQARELEQEHVFDEEKLFKEFKYDFIETNKHFKKYFDGFGDKLIVDDINQMLENPDISVRNRIINYKQRFRQDEKLRYISFVWINLSLITEPHEQTSRYPSSETSSILYNLENAVISHIPDFINLMNKTICKYEEIIKI